VRFWTVDPGDVVVRKTRVFVIDDSPLVRQVLGYLIDRDHGLEVIGSAADGAAAWERIKELAPDVLTLDADIPQMDGLSFLEKVMQSHPVRTLMVSEQAGRGSETTLRALEIGAVDYLARPPLDSHASLQDFARELGAKIRAAAAARLRMPVRVPAPPAPPPAPFLEAVAGPPDRIVVIGASTGGAEALRAVLKALPAGSPGVAVVQHMPEPFTRSFAERLDRVCNVRVREAKSGDAIVPGHVLLAPANRHMRIRRSGQRFLVELSDGAPVNGFRPAVDVLFLSCARQAGAKGVGVLMTGMGDDGARGLLALREAGGRTIVQDESSCVVFGMPREAIERGAAEIVLPLAKIADAVMRSTV
jgi:two-component system, chemotaxis family, protein-glutamate methylesterase/glutaminase